MSIIVPSTQAEAFRFREKRMREEFMMTPTLTQPHKITVNRSDLRQNQSEYLGRARGTSVIKVIGRGAEEDKYVLDKKYFEDLIEQLRSTCETLNVMKDQKLFNQILKASQTIDEDIRLGKLHSFEEAFGED